mmetsp:Transcript_10696/g.15910  ORF Transcript_10696/g.15910 Transcript_10696/m.15910 type:complete len:238 (-) Transcript_10696:778-1491(-)
MLIILHADVNTTPGTCCITFQRERFHSLAGTDSVEGTHIWYVHQMMDAEWGRSAYIPRNLQLLRFCIVHNAVVVVVVVNNVRSRQSPSTWDVIRRTECSNEEGLLCCTVIIDTVIAGTRVKVFAFVGLGTQKGARHIKIKYLGIITKLRIRETLCVFAHFQFSFGCDFMIVGSTCHLHCIIISIIFIILMIVVSKHGITGTREALRFNGGQDSITRLAHQLRRLIRTARHYCAITTR